MVCLDTDFLIAYLEKNPDALEKLQQLQNTPTCTTMINVFELYKGVYRVKEKRREELRIKEILDSLTLLALDYESAKLAGQLDATTRSNSIGESDLLIASIALSNNQTLITRNKKHFERLQGLEVEEW